MTEVQTAICSILENTDEQFMHELLERNMEVYVLKAGLSKPLEFMEIMADHGITFEKIISGLDPDDEGLNSLTEDVRLYAMILPYLIIDIVMVYSTKE